MDLEQIKVTLSIKFKWWTKPFTTVMAVFMLLPKTEWVPEWAGNFIAKHGVKHWIKKNGS